MNQNFKNLEETIPANSIQSINNQLVNIILEKDKKIQDFNSKFPQKKKPVKASYDISVGALKAGKARERCESLVNPNSHEPPKRLRSKSLDILM